MEKDFWLERWARGEIGFHQSEINPHLSQFWSALNPVGERAVFVPLCGKSRDMFWLRKQGQGVLGVELSAAAVQGFFTENDYTPLHLHGARLDSYEADGIRILCGDFFDLSKEDLAGIGAVYDRASLIALPAEMRKRYVGHLVDILPPQSQVLLITVNYLQAEMSGPPFSVPAGEVEALFSEHAEVRLLTQMNVLADNVRFRERGLSQLQENVFLLTLR